MLPREEIAFLPTPVENLPRLSELLGGPRLLIKRDDQTGLAFGGNKTRKLEYLLPAARSEGADMLVTTGAAQSNHCRQTAAAAARFGLDCRLVLVGPEPEQVSGNYFLDCLLGAEIIWTDLENRDKALADACREAEKAGAKPYLIPYGGSNALGAYAYYQAYQEMMDQLQGELPDWVIIPSSSGGTQAGLSLAAAVLGGPPVLGISVDQPQAVLKAEIARIAASLSAVLEQEVEDYSNHIHINSDFTGAGYGILNDQDRQAVHLFAEEEGILLDPVYTGRAAGGMLALIREGFFRTDQRILFWHTGGTPGLFANRYISDL